VKVLIVGNGAREHALAWKVAASPLVGADDLYVTRPTPGIASLAGGTVRGLDLSPTDVDGLVAFVAEESIDLTVVGPEAPLALGLADALREGGCRVVGPGASGARLESSKVFSKDFMLRHGVPTAAAESFDDPGAATQWLETACYPLVLKADGLAAGKGVAICHDAASAIAWIDEVMQDRSFGEAGQRVLAEAFLVGEEASVIVLTDGERSLRFPSSQDHKARDDGDRGPMTGGMGAISPTPLIDEALWARIDEQVIAPTLRGLREEGIDFRGFLYCGLMISNGRPFVLEYNVRLGDPEAQVLLTRMRSDIVPLLDGCARGDVDPGEVSWDPRPSACVVMASGGYPGPYETGRVIHGLEEEKLHTEDEGVVFHAGTRDMDGAVATSGGRVLGVTALGQDLPEAIARAYARADRISFEGAFTRRDIGAKALKSI